MSNTLRPRVLMLTSTLPRWEGDSEPRFVLDLAKQLTDYFDIEILAPHTQGAARSEILEGIKVTRFRYWLPKWESVAYQGGITWRLRENRVRILQVPLFLCSLAWNIFRRLRSEPRIDLVHAHWLIPQGLLAVLARRLALWSGPLVTTSHGGDLFGLKGRLWMILKRYVIRGSDSVTVVSHAMASIVKNIASQSAPVVIPMGTDLTGRFIPPAAPRFGAVKNLIFVGRLVEKKGVTYLLEALTKVVKKHPEIHLNIVGHGPLRTGLEAEVRRLGMSDAVSFVGPIPHQSLAAYYQGAEVAVFPFVEATDGDQEGFGLVMVEAMGAGCAVIASDLPATRDIVKNGVTALSVRPRDPAALAAAIDALVMDPKAASDLARRGREHALENFDWMKVRESLREVYVNMLARS